FFKAEDGIRDKLVTGVQTCALPISNNGRGPWWNAGASHMNDAFRKTFFDQDRKSVVEGKSVDLGGRRIIKQKNTSRGESRTRSAVQTTHTTISRDTEHPR